MESRTAPSTARIKQPNSLTCFVCGMENDHGFRLAFYETSPETVETVATIPEHFQGYPGVAHGGIVTALLDEIAVRAATIGEPDHLMLTARMEVRFRKAVPVGEAVRVVGTLIERRPRATRARGAIILPDGSIGAEGEAMLMDHPASGMTPDALAALGWRVVPD